MLKNSARSRGQDLLRTGGPERSLGVGFAGKMNEKWDQPTIFYKTCLVFGGVSMTWEIEVCPMAKLRASLFWSLALDGQRVSASPKSMFKFGAELPGARNGMSRRIHMSYVDFVEAMLSDVNFRIIL